MAVAGIEEDPGEYAYDIFASAGTTRASPPEKLDYLAAILGQVADFEAIGPDSELPEFLRVWLIGSGVIAHAVEAGPWLAILRRYRDEWLCLARKYSDHGLSWPRWLEVSDNENRRHTYAS